MRKALSFIKNTLTNIWFGIKTSFLASKKYFLLKCLVLLSTTFIPLATIWLWRGILNGVVAGNAKDVFILLIVYLSFKLLTYLLFNFDIYVRARYGVALTMYIENVMIDKTSRIDLAFFDSAKMGDKVRITRSNFEIMGSVAWLVFNIFSAIINVIATFIIVTTINGWIGVLTILLLIPFFIYDNKHTNFMREMEEAQTRDDRKKDYYKNVFYDNNIQFEIKLNKLADFFLGRYKEIWRRLYKKRTKAGIWHTARISFFLLLNFMSELIMLIFSVQGVIAKEIGIGNLQYNISMVARLREQSIELMTNVNRLMVNNVRLKNLKEFIAMKPEYEQCGKRIPGSNPRIEFHNVYFRYPNCEDYVLKNCSFVIEPHEKIALVGQNGSGKSTIIKLMFRFYDPEKGVIKLDGIDIKEYDVYAVRRVFGVLFQDYVTYCLPLREIIALSDFAERFDDGKLQKASDISGVTDIIKDWPDGFDSVLGRYYADNGKDLSGGQWQLVGLARTYFRESEFMILDEPSAALDPISEDRIFAQLYDLSKGKNAVIISHRLSNTTLADKILVLDDGHIVERGSHFELLKQNGKYAYWFNLQASKYV